MRQSMKRFARLTAGHSKEIDNHVAMVALYTTWYNFARINSAVRMSPAMAAGAGATALGYWRYCQPDRRGGMTVFSGKQFGDAEGA
jgi:hypothetical protein